MGNQRNLYINEINNMNKYERRKHLQRYYQKHGIPPVLINKIMNEITISTKINRNFYRSLQKRGRTHSQIMRMIQPERLGEFTKDVYPILNPKEKEVEKISILEKIYNFFF